MMIAHSLRGDVFGPAQRLHGATYVVDATFRRATLDADGIVVDIGRAAEVLRAVVGELGYRNLDDEEALEGMNTTTEALARVIADRLADRAGRRAGGGGRGARWGVGGASPVLLDGLIASTTPEALVPHARRLRQVVLVHMPLGHRPPASEAGAVRAREREVLVAATAIVTTSAWTRRRLGELYALPADRVHVAEPGVDAASLAPGTAAGGALLCVAALTPGKGHDVLLDALATATDLSWRCVCVGSLERAPVFADGVRRRARDNGLGGRV